MSVARYDVNHPYRSRRDGVDYGPWAAGDTVDLHPDDAEWVNRDSPGCLTEPAAEPEPEPEPVKRAQPKAADRQHRGGRNRGT